MLDDAVGSAYFTRFPVTEPTKYVALEVFVRMRLAQHRHRVDPDGLLITTLVPVKVPPRDEAFAPSAQSDVAVCLGLTLRHEVVYLHIGALCRALDDIGVIPIYAIPSDFINKFCLGTIKQQNNLI